MNTVWILEKRHHERAKVWKICDGAWLGGTDRKDVEERAKRFTETSLGWKFRAVPFDRRKKAKK